MVGVHVRISARFNVLVESTARGGNILWDGGSQCLRPRLLLNVRGLGDPRLAPHQPNYSTLRHDPGNAGGRLQGFFPPLQSTCEGHDPVTSPVCRICGNRGTYLVEDLSDR